MRKLIYLSILLTFFTTSSAWSADISGTWTVKHKTPQNEDETFDLFIKADGDNLTITCSNHPKLTNLAGTGTLKGDAITMKVTATGEQKVVFEFTGKVTGNKMSGTREISQIMSDSDGRGSVSAGGQGGAPADAAAGGPDGAQGGPPSGGQGGQASSSGEASKAFTAEKK